MTPLGFICVFICVRTAPHFYSPSSRRSSLLQGKLTSIEHTRLWRGNIHPHPHSTFPKPIYPAPLVERKEVQTTQEWVVQRGALMWHKHMCSAWAQSLLKHTHKTQFYCLLCGIITPRRCSGGMLRRRGSEGAAATSCARQCQAELLELYGHPEGEETCPV